MKSLIIGAAGFVGAYAIRQLSEKGEVHAAKLPQEQIAADCKALCTVHDLDILDAEATAALLNAIQPDCILHLAAQSSVALSWKKPQLTADINIKGTVNLLEAARMLPEQPRILLIGSGEEYGALRPEQIPVREDTPLHPANVYAATKAAAEQFAQLYVRAYGMEIVTVRAFNHFGPGQRPDFVAADFCRQAAEIECGLHEPVIRTGNLSAKRDFTDVRDIVRAYALLLEKGRAGAVYNVGSGKAIAVSDILAMIREQCRVPFAVETDPAKLRPVDVPVIAADITALQADTGWSPQISAAQTVSDMLEDARRLLKEQA
ncbi:MAG: GDP-mannose 4,6-dehydratase [Oscillospiraceae bacterium]|nr:GDP-mannose 4,6-dehydratase [Oscillospiraceae bacterium]